MKRIWTVSVPGYRPFSMVLMEGLMDHSQALAEARSIWTNCNVR